MIDWILPSCQRQEGKIREDKSLELDRGGKRAVILSRHHEFFDVFHMQMHKDVGLALTTPATLKIPVPLGSLRRELLAMMQGIGLGEADTTALSKFYEQMVGHEVRLKQ